MVALIAATTALAGLLQVQSLVNGLRLTTPIKNAQVTIPAPGAAETLLLIGSDHRAGEPYATANTDTMLLVRMDPASSTINLLSVPRDLQVRLPDGSIGRLNATYSAGGGPNGLLTALKTQVFPGFHVNHVIDVNFKGFSDLIDAIGCVYTDVDHRYYNLSAPGPNNYSSIDIQPGYQKLCGANQSETGALAFVRFRHTDTDIVRNARQQDFLRWAKDQYGLGNLISNRDRLVRIFGAHTQTDKYLQSLDGLLSLFDLLLNMAGHQIKQIPFPAQFAACGGMTTINGVATPTPCYVTAKAALEARVYQQFMTPTSSAATPQSAKNAVSQSGGPHPHKPASGGFDTAGAVSDIANGQSQASALGRAGFPVYYPTLAVPGAQYCSSITGNCNSVTEPASEYLGSYPRQYEIHDNGHAYKSYRITVVVNSTLGEYYGIQGTEWKTPPILDKPTQRQVVNGRTLLEYFNGRKLSMVAWRTANAAYWVSNTLADTIPPKQLIAIAASLRLSR